MTLSSLMLSSTFAAAPLAYAAAGQDVVFHNATVNNRFEGIESYFSTSTDTTLMRSMGSLLRFRFLCQRGESPLQSNRHLQDALTSLRQTSENGLEELALDDKVMMASALFLIAKIGQLDPGFSQSTPEMLQVTENLSQNMASTFTEGSGEELFRIDRDLAWLLMNRLDDDADPLQLLHSLASANVLRRIGMVRASINWNASRNDFGLTNIAGALNMLYPGVDQKTFVMAQLYSRSFDYFSVAYLLAPDLEIGIEEVLVHAFETSARMGIERIQALRRDHPCHPLVESYHDILNEALLRHWKREALVTALRDAAGHTLEPNISSLSLLEFIRVARGELRVV